MTVKFEWYKFSNNALTCDQGFFIHKWWTLTKPKQTFYSTYESLEMLDKGINQATFDSLKEAKESFQQTQNIQNK